MKRILFVDDELQILEGLQNLLRKQRKEWEMTFALGGQKGLEELARAPFDVVISDMRMPGMDGAEFLGRVRDLYPATARIVLSGHAEREMLLRVVPVAQQFLSKPCDGALVKSVIERSCSLQECLSSTAIRGLVGSLENLPTVPEIYHELTRVLAEPGSGLAEVAEVVEQDPSMSAKFLQLVNSAYFGLPTRVGSIKQAVGFLGADLIRSLALTAHVFSVESSRPIEGLSCRALQESALQTARLARRFIGAHDRGNDAFTAGLLHDIGKLVLVQGVPDEFERILASARGSGRPLHVVEREVLGVTHAEIGAYLLGLWGLPFETIEAVCYHHEPARMTGGEQDLLAVVHAADAFADFTCVMDPRNVEGAIDVAFLERCGFADRLPGWREIARETLLAA